MNDAVSKLTGSPKVQSKAAASIGLSELSRELIATQRFPCGFMWLGETAGGLYRFW